MERKTLRAFYLPFWDYRGRSRIISRTPSLNFFSLILEPSGTIISRMTFSFCFEADMMSRVLSRSILIFSSGISGSWLVIQIDFPFSVTPVGGTIMVFLFFFRCFFIMLTLTPSRTWIGKGYGDVYLCPKYLVNPARLRSKIS